MRNQIPFQSLGTPPSDSLSSFGGDFYIDYDANVMYVPDGSGGWVQDANMTSLLQQSIAVSPSAVQQADNSSGSSLSSFLTSLTNAIPALIQGDAQRQLMQINLERARQGKPPLNASQYTPGVQVGLSSDTKSLVTMLGIGALGVLALGRLR